MPNNKLLEVMARAHDREEAAHWGEPSPWDCGDLDPDWVDGRLHAMRAAFAALQEHAAPFCQECGDGITAHGPGICGTCYAVKYAGGGWVKCSERLPEDGAEVVVYTEGGMLPPRVTTSWFRRGTGQFDEFGVLMWQPLPAAPQPEEVP